MIGEMRDSETAIAAISAALSGQMVFTTLHSNDALRAVERLRELGIAPRALAAAVSAVVAQRLLRRLCAECKQPTRLGRYEAAGCELCGHSGYRGRIAVFEIVAVAERLRNAIAMQAGIAELRASALEAGYEPLSVAAMQLVECGETTFDEVRRALSAETP